MTIVCFSAHTPPLNDAEAFCTARFLSALAEQRVNVHLVTLNQAEQVDQSVVSELLHRDITVTRIALPETGRWSQSFSKHRHLSYSPYAEHLPVILEGVRRVLSGYDRPILLTRTYPVISNVVGFYLRHLAARWVAHFGDPFPGFGMYSRRNQWRWWLDLWWAKRIFTKADLVTVTCRNAVKHFCKTLKQDFSGKMEVTYHIGSPAIQPSQRQFNPTNGHFEMAHVGYWSQVRYMREMFSEVQAAWEEWPDLRLIQFGLVEKATTQMLAQQQPPWLQIESGTLTSPRDASAVLGQADVNVVIDQNDRLPYCQYLASKFVYAVCSGRPVLGIGQQDSEMAMLAREFPSLHFADIRKAGEVRRKISSFRGVPKNEIVTPAADLKELFSPQCVASKFLRRLELLPQIT